MSDELANLTEAEWAALLSNSPPALQLDQAPLGVPPAAAAVSSPQSHVPLRIGPIAVVPSILNRTAVNAPAQGRAVAPSETIPNFYYETSTFHHLSSWRLRYQQMTSDILQGRKRRLSENQGDQEEEPADEDQTSPPQPVLTSAPMLDGIPAQTVVFHVDLDCFYVSVAVRDNPSLAGRPVAVCPASRFTGTSEIASASYEARAFGIKSRMHVGEARKLCPDLICVPCNYAEYEKVSLQMYEIFTRHTNRVMAVSADEAYLDMSAFPDALKAAEALRKDIKTATGCSASIGISHNMLLARIATKKAKPNGVFHLTRDNFFDYLAEQNVRDLPGFGPATVDRLKRRSITRVSELRILSKETLQNEFGKKHGEMMWNYARGVDERIIAVQQHTRKSVGTQISWGVRFQEMAQLERFLHDVATEVQRRMRELGTKGRRINLRIKKRAEDAPEPTKLFNPGRHSIVHKSATLTQATDDADVIARECLRMYKQSRIALSDFRGVGLSIDQLEGPRTARDRRLRTLDDMLKPQPQPQPAQQQQTVQVPAAASGDDGAMPVDEEMMQQDEELDWGRRNLSSNSNLSSNPSFNPSSDSPPTMTLSPEEAAREAELLRDRQPSPDLYEYSPPTPTRPQEEKPEGEEPQEQQQQQTETMKVDGRAEESPVTGTQQPTQINSTPEELRNVVIASEQPGSSEKNVEVCDLTALSATSSDDLVILPVAPPKPHTPAATLPQPANIGRKKKAAAVRGRGQGRGGAGRGQQQRFRQLDLGSFTGANKGV